MFGKGAAATFGSLAFGATTDAVYLPVAAGGTGDLKLTTAYGVRGAFNHNWDPYWSTSLFGGVGWVKYGGTAGNLTTAQRQYCAAYFKAIGAANMATATCNPNYSLSELGVVTRWTPVKNLTLWTHLNTGFTGTATLTPRRRCQPPCISSRTRTPCRSTYALSATSDPDTDHDREKPRRETAGVLHDRASGGPKFASFARSSRKSSRKHDPRNQKDRELLN